MALPRSTSLAQIADAYGSVEAGLRTIFEDEDAITISDEGSNQNYVDSEVDSYQGNNADDDNESTTSTIDYLPNGTHDDIEFDFENPQEYVRYLRSLEPEIDEYLANKQRGNPTEDMLRYSEYSWNYNDLSNSRRMRLTCIRYHSEKHNRSLKEIAKEKAWATLERHDEMANNKKPVCTICYNDLRCDFHYHKGLFGLKCGHIFHKYCVKKLYTEHHSNRCPFCNAESEYSDGKRIFLNYS